MRCTVCSNPLVSEVDVLLATGSSVRKVARMYAIPRTNLGRHKAHVAPASRPFAVIDTNDGPPGPGDPLSEAILLAERARTPRERLRALEQVRAATKLSIRGRADLGTDELELLSANIAQAEAAYRDAPDFETQARALSGWREAFHHRIDATGEDEPVDVPMPTVCFADGRPARPAWLEREEQRTVKVPASLYWAGVPQRFRDRTRYVVSRTITLTWEGQDAVPETIEVLDAEGVLVWKK
jgi:hypothetical protein